MILFIKKMINLLIAFLLLYASLCIADSTDSTSITYSKPKPVQMYVLETGEKLDFGHYYDFKTTKKCGPGFKPVLTMSLRRAEAALSGCTPYGQLILTLDKPIQFFGNGYKISIRTEQDTYGGIKCKWRGLEAYWTVYCEPT